MLSLLDTKYGQIIFSVILGLGLASLFRKVCEDGNCIVIEGPPLDKVENKVFQQEGKCYVYKSQSSSCKKTKK
jgi:hypothetical protein